MEVSNDRVTILSDVAELKDQIDVPRARAAKERAEAELRTDADSEAAAAGPPPGRPPAVGGRGHLRHLRALGRTGLQALSLTSTRARSSAA